MWVTNLPFPVSVLLPVPYVQLSHLSSESGTFLCWPCPPPNSALPAALAACSMSAVPLYSESPIEQGSVCSKSLPYRAGLVPGRKEDSIELPRRPLTLSQGDSLNESSAGRAPSFTATTTTCLLIHDMSPRWEAKRACILDSQYNSICKQRPPQIRYPLIPVLNR